MLIAKNLNVSKIVDYGLLNLVSLLFILVNNILFFSGSTTYNIPLRLSGLLVVKRMQKKRITDANAVHFYRSFSKRCLDVVIFPKVWRLQ